MKEIINETENTNIEDEDYIEKYKNKKFLSFEEFFNKESGIDKENDKLNEMLKEFNIDLDTFNLHLTEEDINKNKCMHTTKINNRFDKNYTRPESNSLNLHFNYDSNNTCTCKECGEVINFPKENNSNYSYDCVDYQYAKYVTHIISKTINVVNIIKILSFLSKDLDLFEEFEELHSLIPLLKKLPILYLILCRNININTKINDKYGKRIHNKYIEYEKQWKEANKDALQSLIGRNKRELNRFFDSIYCSDDAIIEKFNNEYADS